MLKLAYLADVVQEKPIIPEDFLTLIKIESENLADFNYEAVVEYNIDDLKYDDDTEIEPIETNLDFDDFKRKVEADENLSTSVLNLCSNFLINVMKPRDILRTNEHYTNLVAEIQKCKQLHAQIEAKKVPAGGSA